MKKRWIIMMTLMVIISLIGVFTPETAGVWEPDEKMNTANVAWMITATIFVLMMTPGLSFFYGGMVGKKNVISTILQSFIAMGIISVIWVVFGFSLAFGDDIGGFVGNPATFFMFNISLLISVAKVQIICDFVRIFTENHYFCANILKA
jgi:Amt family ammonium transporter